ncbi:MAG: UpxY family transcription antiterminator [Bacteroidetes bacterium]|jgi:transcriptional antiterminator NusG|nr:MAG: UpxY family transcription antiterminator [Bacteroidota bacterium]
MESGKNWYAVYTRPKWEKKVSELLSRKKIENYCPLYKSVRQWSDRKKTIMEPLFTSYVFVNIEENGQLPVKQTDGILNFVYWLGKPAVIKNEEIDVIRQFLSENDHVKLEQIEVNLNDRVKIINGPFQYWEGSVTEIRPKSVKVLLPSLGYALVAEIPKSRVELISTNYAMNEAS